MAFRKLPERLRDLLKLGVVRVSAVPYAEIQQFLLVIVEAEYIRYPVASSRHDWWRENVCESRIGQIHRRHSSIQALPSSLVLHGEGVKARERAARVSSVGGAQQRDSINTIDEK